MDTGERRLPTSIHWAKSRCLILDDDTVLFDSRVIVEYLDNVAPNNKLMPGANRER
jgi:glutathione S-transferase